MTFAESLSEKERRRAARNAIYSALCGCISEMAVDTSTVLVIYISMLGGGDATKMFITGLTPIATVGLSLVCSVFCDRLGLRKAMTTSCIAAFLAFVLMAASAFTDAIALPFFVVSTAIYCLTRPLYVTCWYPLIDHFLRPGDRSRFFSTMRFCYSSLNALLMFGIGAIVTHLGGVPPVWFMQAVFLLCAFGSLGRMFFANQIPIGTPPDAETRPSSPQSHAQRYSLREGLGVSLRNGPLMGFCLYFCMINIVAFSFVPLMVVYMKSQALDIAPSAILKLTAVSLAGSLCGFLFSTGIIKAIGTKATILANHFVCVILPALLFFCGPGVPHLVAIFGVVQFIAAFSAACIGVVNSSESLALARPGNKTVALAVCQISNFLGNAAGRFGTSALLACDVLAPEWTCAGMSVTRFQSIFGAEALMMLFFTVFIVILPAFIPRHEDYYEP